MRERAIKYEHAENVGNATFLDITQEIDRRVECLGEMGETITLEHIKIAYTLMFCKIAN